jgi:arylformamidase
VLIDISVPLSVSTPAWPGDTPFSCGWICRRETGESVNLSAITASPHVGTHADAPMHIESDWAASELLPISAFVGEAVVLALPHSHATSDDVSVELLQSLLADVASAVRGTESSFDFPTRILLRTGCSVSPGQFPSDWPTLSVSAAEWLVARGLQLWGSDAPSVDRRTSKTLPVHHALFAGGAFILETLALDAVAPGPYELLAQPLAIHGADAAPVRALLRR